MTALTQDTDYFIGQGLPNIGIKTMIVSTINTVDNGDTLDVVLSKYGIGSIMGVIGFTHTTDNSVVIQEQPTTSISGGTLTITVGGSSANQIRHYLIYGNNAKHP